MTIVEQGVSIDDAVVNDRDNNEDRETEEIVTISPHHRIFHKTRLSLLESKAAKYDAIMNQLRLN